MKVYVATAFGNIPEARAVMQALQAEGHVITHDWTTEASDPAMSPAEREAFMQKSGRADFEGVVRADALVLINHEACRDSMAEFGIAVGLGIPVYVLHVERRTSVFFHRATAVAGIIPLLDCLEEAEFRTGRRAPCF